MWLLPLYYFPPISWFTACVQADRVLLDLQAPYVKQHYTNRMMIRGANGVLTLSVPVSRRQDSVNVREKKIVYQEKWQRGHWRSIYFSYKNSPYFDYYADYFKPFFEQPYDHLWQLNYDIIQMLAKLLSITTPIETLDTPIHLYAETIARDLRLDFHPRREQWPAWYQPIPYPQVFEGFEPDLSIIDLLCNEGPESRRVLAEGDRSG